MRKRNEEWEAMDNRQRRDWLQRLWPHEVRAQAEERARGTGRSAGEVLASWAANGFISRRVRRQAETGEE